MRRGLCNTALAIFAWVAGRWAQYIYDTPKPFTLYIEINIIRIRDADGRVTKLVSCVSTTQ